MKESLLELLQSPETGEKLELRDAHGENGEIINGRLCSPSGEEFPIVRGVPRFVKDEHYAASFGLQWSLFSRTQLDSANGTSQSRDTFQEKTGWKLSELEGATVLEAGCGMGRFLEVASGAAGSVVGIDMSAAVDAAYENLKGRGNIHIIQADIFHLPLRRGNFDRIYSIGVLHHTPDTRLAFGELIPLLAEGGEISIWVYGKSIRNPIALCLSDLYRMITTKMPRDKLLNLAKCAKPLGKIYRVPGLGTALNTLLPISPHPDPEWRWLDTFDWYSPRYQFRHTSGEVRTWFEEAALEDIVALPVPVSMKGKKRKG